MNKFQEKAKVYGTRITSRVEVTEIKTKSNKFHIRSLLEEYLKKNTIVFIDNARHKFYLMGLH